MFLLAISVIIYLRTAILWIIYRRILRQMLGPSARPSMLFLTIGLLDKHTRLDLSPLRATVCKLPCHERSRRFRRTGCAYPRHLCIRPTALAHLAISEIQANYVIACPFGLEVLLNVFGGLTRFCGLSCVPLGIIMPFV